MLSDAEKACFLQSSTVPLTPFVIVAADYSGDGSSARRARKRSSGDSPGDGQALRSSGRQSTARVKRSNNPPPGQSKRKATETEEEDEQAEKKYRKCEKAGCSAMYPVCFASASDRCAKNGYTSRWYHLSCGEHFCNECFDHYYRSHKDGYETFASWKKVWTSNGKSEPSLKAFMADQQLPFWVQCTKPDCRKWRQLTKEIQLTYRCGLKVNDIKSEAPDQCSQPEDLRVAEVSDSWWHSMLILPPLLKESPAGAFLSAYYPDCVGVSPSGSPCDVSMAELRTDPCRAVQPQIPGLCPYFQPFYQPNECGKALCVRPDMMELDELYEFPEFSRDPTMYLALRNLILASWHKNCQEVLTAEKCAQHIVVRGLVRVCCVQELDRVLHFMTRKGLVNTGVLAVKQPLLPEKYCSKKVIIGAGASGLAAARQLQNFGTQVVVLEARDRIGGRVWDDTSLGVTVGRGAQIVNGCVNNPIALMCEQIALQFPNRFWDSKIQGADYFGHIPPSPERRGMFSVFYDLDPQGKRAVLMSIMSGDAVSAVGELEDLEVVDECMKVLRELFKDQEVPDPLNYFVTHWNKDIWSQMSYSFVKTGGSGEAYDILAEDVQGKVFFAGEATNRHFPQTVTGAYLSGVREASKMAAV
ncbi:lysine-specific histone demethylase 1B-like isoform X2 [Girardinichthys multiradiatus]|uniref:lysine-specific histone demethylase 1B-like isoform X2 n=1 Tax=Girardinichthys multiradiatus TaxID=208333 RepID=UPI001FAB8D3B|nr:lysine-specific histone demethylase 1B-like isoform X2 [Girardinichthys multiradiatus]